MANPTGEKESNHACKPRCELSPSSEGERDGDQPLANHAQLLNAEAKYYITYVVISHLIQYIFQAIFA